MKDHRFLEYDPSKPLELPPDIRKWLPEEHLALFISDVVDTLDLSEITEEYHHLQGGHPAYHPAMMVKLLFYGYCVGVRSSRRIEQKTYEDVAFRVLSCDSHPDHSRISDFRKRHLAAISRLFLQVLWICKEAGLVKLGHVALDGTKIKANASKHKAMSYDRMVKKEKELAAEVAKLLEEAEALDEKEDKKYGKGKRGDELPEDLKFREKRLAKIRQATQALEEQAAQEAASKAKSDKSGNPPEDGASGTPDAKPEPKKQRNFTDPDSRIMLDGATKAFTQAYNAQAGVDCDSQVIVCADVTQQANDKQQLVPMLDQIEENLGEIPDRALADAGYFSEEAVESVANGFTEPYVPRGRKKHSDPPEPPPRGRIPKKISVVERTQRKLKTKPGQEVYSKRKETIEPVFGQIKENRGIRAFLLRGFEAVKGEWNLICLTHNLLKLWKHLWLDHGRGAPAFGEKAQKKHHIALFILDTVIHVVPVCLRSAHSHGFRAS
jgi:transposase